MPTALLPALRFAQGWATLSGPTPPAHLMERVEAEALPGFSERIPVLKVGPRGVASRAAPRPRWVVLHGMTTRGLDHPSLRRLTRALAASGAEVWAPLVAPWTRLELAPESARTLVRSTVVAMAEGGRSGGPTAEGVRLAGFSFAGPQALLAAADAEPGGPLAGALRSVLVWGSYARLEPTLQFAFTGRFQHRRGVGQLRPDPYVRWIAGANLLPFLEEARWGDTQPLAAVLLRMAKLWGDESVDAFGPAGAEMAHREREGLPASGRDLFDLFVPPGPEHAAGVVEPEASLPLVKGLVEAVRRHAPLLDPLPDRVGRIPGTVHLFHGRQDTLIPFSETEALEAELRPKAGRVNTLITDLFAHSASASMHPGQWVEGARFLSAMGRTLGQ